MKFQIILFIISNLLFFQCEQNISNNVNFSIQNQPNVTDSNANLQNKNMNGEVFNFNGKDGELEYNFKGIIQPKGNYEGINYLTDNLVISYTLKNIGLNEYLVFNQGHSNKNLRNIIYVEAKNDEEVELSQKMFVQPTDKMCPNSYIAIMPRASLLKAKNQLQDKAMIELPLRQNHPYDNCTPINPMPKNTKKVRFCLGIAEKDKSTLLTKEGFPNPRIEAEKQKILCSDYFEIK